MTAMVLSMLQNAKSAPLGSVLIWVGVLMTLTLLGGLAVLWYRKQVLSKAAESDPGTLMEQFRRMRDSGEMSAEEFEATKRAMVAKMRGSQVANSDKPAADGGFSGKNNGNR
jgi:hypothetical protein